MASTPYQTSDTLLNASTLASVTPAVAATGTTTTTPYGFTTAAQGDAVVTQVNALIVQVNAIVALLKAKGVGTIQ